MKENDKDTEYLFQDEFFGSYEEMRIFIYRKLAEAYKNGDDAEITKLKEINERIVPHLKQEREDNMISYWNKLDVKFKEAKDVPSLNLFGDLHQTVVIPALIRCGAIPKEELKNGHFYHGSYRNNTFGKWIADESKFEIWRVKFGSWFTDKCNHFQDDDGFALFVPIREASEEEYENSHE